MATYRAVEDIRDSRSKMQADKGLFWYGVSKDESSKGEEANEDWQSIFISLTANEELQANIDRRRLSKSSKGDERISLTDNEELQANIDRRRLIPKAGEAEQVAGGWPSWLAAVAGEAIAGWIPRRADSFEKLDLIGKGAYSNVYKARDLTNGKIVVLKKVRFDNLDPSDV